MLRPELAKILLERHLVSTDWIEAAPLQSRTCLALRAYRRKLLSIRARGDWGAMAELTVTHGTGGFGGRS